MLRKSPACRALAFVAALLLSLDVFPSPAFADSSAAQYDALISEAVEEYDLSHFPEALALFERAHQLSPSARTLRGMGLASYQARRYVMAMGYLRAALEDKRKPLSPKFREDVEAALAASEKFVAKFSLHVQPAEASVLVDGTAVEADTEVISLDPGEHDIVASLDGYQTEQRRITAISGREGQLSFQLSPVQPVSTTQEIPPPVVAGAAAAPVAARKRAPMGLKVLTFTGLSVALVGGVVGTVAGLKALSIEDGLRCPDRQCSGKQAERLDEGKAWGAASTASLAVGGAGLVAGLVGVALWTRHKKHATSNSTSKQLTARPFGAGVAISGRF